MIAQFDKPTIFLTMSAAERYWDELINILYEVANHTNKDLSEGEIKSMTYDQKNRLIQNDLVLCVSYFEHKMRCVFKTFDLNAGPFGK